MAQRVQQQTAGKAFTCGRKKNLTRPAVNQWKSPRKQCIPLPLRSLQNLVQSKLQFLE
jgi:hypothetical protein